MKKSILIFMSGCIFGVMLYILLWSGWSDRYQLRPLQEKDERCYIYHSTEDVKNIARHAIIEQFGNIELRGQRRLVLSNFDDVYVLEGAPKGVLGLMFDYLSAAQYLPRVSVVLKKGNQSCLYITEVFYQKD